MALTLAFLGMATLGFNRARIGGLAVSDLLFAASASVIVAKLLAGESRDLAPAPMRRTSPVLVCASLVLLTCGAVSAFRSWDPLGSMQVVARFAWLTLVWFWILRTVARDRRSLDKLLSGLRIAALVSSFLAIIGFLGIYTAGAMAHENRQMAYMGHPNDLAALLLFILPLFVFDLPRPRGQRPSLSRRLALTTLVLAAIMTTGSMTSFFAAVVTLLTCAALVPASRGGLRLRRHTGLAAIAVGTLVIAGLVALSYSSLPVVERFTRFQEGDSYIEDSVGTRDRLNDAAISHLDDTLVVGTGLQLQSNADPSQLARVGSGSAAPEAVQGVHNMFLKLAHEAGVPALAALIVIIVIALRQAWRVAVSARDSDLHLVAVSVFAAIVADNTIALFEPIAYHRYYWAPIALATCLWSIRRHEIARDMGGRPGRQPDDPTEGQWPSRG